MLVQQAVEEKSNGIRAIPALLERIDRIDLAGAWSPRDKRGNPR
jgi:hypothetical protein